MKKTIALATASMAFALQACTAYADEPVASAPVAADTEVAALDTAERVGPGLWKVADDDTTIYLFGTVHALPENVEWYSDSIKTALESSGTLVTEITDAEMNDPAMQQTMMARGILAEGTLRSVLTPEQTATYEAALGTLGVPPEAFDRFEPWLAGMTLSILPLLQNGWTAESGVEKVIEGYAGPDKERIGLETIDYQIGVFDGLPQETQVEFLIATAEMIDDIIPTMDKMIDVWAKGDADTLAELMNEAMDDPKVAEALLYQRNRNWADWIDTRMDQPGTVFIAVGAGHLAGDKSVQDYLTQRDIAVTRVQ